MTRRLLVSYLGLALLTLVVLEVPLGVLAQGHERDVSASQAAREATGLAEFVTEDTEHPSPADDSQVRGGGAGSECRMGA